MEKIVKYELCIHNYENNVVIKAIIDEIQYEYILINWKSILKNEDDGKGYAIICDCETNRDFFIPYSVIKNTYLSLKEIM